MALLGLCLLPFPAQAEIDGHGPDAWRVHDVAADDALNARMGPGTEYLIIDTFAHDERGLHQVTCVPLLLMASYQTLSQAQIDALPPRWCLMRSADLSKAGWVLQRFLVEDGYEPVDSPTIGPNAVAGEDLIAHAQDLVRALYEAADLARMGGPQPLAPANAGNYFSSDVVAGMQTRPLQADPLYGAQDFDGTVGEPEPDRDQPMLRGMITLNVAIVNFGQPHTAVFRLRADPERPGAPIRIFRIEHDGWSFP
ncbi:hypothetical protein A9995_11665 [Erythrobacter sp. QSSC1-22B]|nr:hypothetical protein A9995_11665 [Erythrobacter sp. QSSC1-22B]